MPLPAARLCFPGTPGEGSAAPGALPAGSAGPAAMAPGLQPPSAAPAPPGPARLLGQVTGVGGGGHSHRGGTEPCDRPWLFRGLSSRPGGQRESGDHHRETFIYIFIVLIQKTGIGEGEEPARLQLSGVPNIPHRQCRLGHLRWADISVSQLLPSSLKALLGSLLLAGGAGTPGTSWSQGSSITEPGAGTQGQRQGHSAGCPERQTWPSAQGAS